MQLIMNIIVFVWLLDLSIKFETINKTMKLMWETIKFFITGGNNGRRWNR